MHVRLVATTSALVAALAAATAAASTVTLTPVGSVLKVGKPIVGAVWSEYDPKHPDKTNINWKR